MAPSTGSASGTLYRKEVRRFLAVGTQTVLAPMVTTLLFLAVFVLALGHSVESGGRCSLYGIPGARPHRDGDDPERLCQRLLLADDRQDPGQHRRSPDAALVARWRSRWAWRWAASPAASSSACATARRASGCSCRCAPHPVPRWSSTRVMASLMLAQLGIIAGIYAEKFDHMAAVTNFIITPLAFLSGTFYSTERAAGTGPLARASQPVLLHDRRLPLRHDRSRRRVAAPGRAGAHRRECGPADRAIT